MKYKDLTEEEKRAYRQTYGKEYRAKNKEREKTRKAKWYQDNRIRIGEHQKQYRANPKWNGLTYEQYRYARLKANPEAYEEFLRKSKIANRMWKKNNRNHYLAYQKAYHRAKKKESLEQRRDNGLLAHEDLEHEQYDHVPEQEETNEI